MRDFFNEWLSGKMVGVMLLFMIAGGVLSIVAGFLHIFTSFEIIQSRITGEFVDTAGAIRTIVVMVFWTAFPVFLYVVRRKNLKNDK